MRVTIDFETRSRCDLKKCGVYVYSEDPTTDILCLAVKVEADNPRIWIPEKFRSIHATDLTDNELREIVKSNEVSAHNANFERCLWREGMHKRYGFADIPLAQWHCTAAKASYYALPRDLSRACEAMGLSEQKDKEGYKVMMLMCKPLAANRKKAGQFHEDTASFAKLVRYCLQDVEAEYELDLALRDIPTAEKEIWRLDQEINDRGIAVDVKSIECIISRIQEYESQLLSELVRITKGQLRSVRQVEATRQWLKDTGLDLPDLTKGTVREALAGTITPTAKRVLEIRQALGKSSVSKYASMQKWACADDRVRGTLLYHGASTGRWSGKGIQPQNYPRGSLKEQTETALFDLCVIGNEFVQDEYGCPLEVASSCLRSVLYAGKGKELVCGDFSQIEARVLAWLAGQQSVLDAFIGGKDLYKVAASAIFATDYADITKDQRQIGKTAELALGYQGGIGAFSAMSKITGTDLESMVEPVLSSASKDQFDTASFVAEGYFANLKRHGIEPEITVPQAHACDIVKQKWRGNRPHIVRFWHCIEDAAIKAVKEQKIFSYRGIKFGIHNGFLMCRLPSGRMLSYRAPEIREVKTSWGGSKHTVTFMGMNTMINKWVRQKTYGGKLTENIVQAVSRDILTYAMLNLREAGYDIVATVHDEIVAEVDSGSGALGAFTKIMGRIPPWATGCPIGAEGWQGKRYRKD